MVFNCMVFGSCDTESKQVIFQCVIVHCRWILQDQEVKVPGCGGLMQQQVYNSFHYLELPSCQSEVVTAESLFGLAAPFSYSPVLPSPAPGP